MSKKILPTGPDYLETPLRREGPDHDFFPWRDTWAEGRLRWNGDTTLGIWIQIAVEWFPLNISDTPFLPIGAPNRPWPDSETYTQRDYGNRVGIFRMMDALAAREMTASACLNARLAARYPALAREIAKEGWDVVAAGFDAGAIHHDGLTKDTEQSMIAEALSLLQAEGLTPVAWHSPSWSQSSRTPALLVDAGVNAMADWGNDEAPYQHMTASGPITSLPAAFELCDREIIANRQNSLADFECAMIAAAQRLAHEAEETGQHRLLTINLSPWIMGQPFRIVGFERILDAFAAIQGAKTVQVAEIMAASQAAND
ncbi:MAG: polysaccharide deacetylase [Pseudomonadota bacterium]|nr:polysaccharide deacetylase [Pseudomonadota bacterium]